MKEKKIKSKIIFHIVVFFLIILFAFIIEKNVSLPQAVIRPIGILAITSIFYISFFKPFIPFLILIVYFPFSKILVGDFEASITGLNLTNILVLISMLGWFSRILIKRERFFEKSSLNFPIFLFIFWGVFSLIQGYFRYGSTYFENFIIPLKQWLTPILLYFITYNLVKDKQSFKRIVITMMIVICIVGLMAVKDYMDVGDAGSIDKSRVGGVFEQPNTLGGFFVYNMFLFAGFLLAYFPNMKYLFMLVPLSVCFRGIQVTFSRGAYFGFVSGGIAATFFKNKILFAIVLYALIFAILNPAVLPEGIRYRMESTFYGGDKIFATDIDEIKDPSAQKRITIWLGAIQMIRDYPIFGVGYGLFPHIIPFYVPVGYADAHNTYLILAAEMGIPALLIFLLILFLMIKNARWVYRKSQDKFMKAFALGLLGGLFGLLMVNMFGSRLNSEEVSAYFWIYSGLIMSAVRITKEEIGSNKNQKSNKKHALQKANNNRKS